MYTLKQASEKLGISIVTLRRYIKQGKLTAKKVGKEYRIAEADMEALLAATAPTDPEELIEHALETNDDYRYEFQRSDALSKAAAILLERGEKERSAEIDKDALVFGYRLIVQSRAEKSGKTNRGRFSPRMTGKDAQGNDAAWPDPALINESLVEHSKKRAASVKNPITKAIYCDLVYEFSKNADRPKYGKEAAKLYLQAADIEPEDDQNHRLLNTQSYILRSMEIALALKDDALYRTAVDYAMTKMETLANENRMRILHEIIEVLLKTPKKLTNEDITKIASLIDRAAESYFEQKNQHLGRSFVELKKLLPETKASLDEQRKVQRALYDSYIQEGVDKSASSMVAAHFYSEALKIGRGVLSEQEEAELRQRIEQANLKAEDEMQSHSFDFVIKNEEIKGYVDAVLVDDNEKSLIRIALLPGMIPSVERAKETAEKMLKEFPISQMFSRSSLQDGRVVSITPGGTELSETHIMDRLNEEIQVHGLFLSFLFDELKRRGLDAQKLAAFLSQRDFFDNESLPAVSEALTLFFDEKYFSFVTVIQPQLEQLLRLANRKLGKPTLRSLDNGEQRVIYLQEALSGMKDVLDSLSPDAYMFFSLVLIDKRGPGLRDSAAHGLLEHSTANKNQANLLLQLLLILAIFEYKKLNENGGDEAQTVSA